MRKILVICATAATLGAAALTSTQASAAIQIGRTGQIDNLSNATRNPHDGDLLGERRPEGGMGAFGFKFGLASREGGALCGVWGSSCFY